MELSVVLLVIVMDTLGERGELASTHGRPALPVLMVQDMGIEPIMALVPIPAHATGDGAPTLL